MRPRPRRERRARGSDRRRDLELVRLRRAQHHARPRARRPMSLDEARRTRAEALLGHTFADPSLLAAALTHPNAAGQGGPDWQRLEFLGDSVLNVAVSEAIFLRHPEVPEGGLTKLRATMVSGPALTEVFVQRIAVTWR
ncbi:MAG: hypothetical protein FDZ70_02990, partial [Actinobacteria bacterium]